MAEAQDYSPVKLICGLIAGSEPVFQKSKEELIAKYGPIDSASKRFDFTLTDYYEKQMGGPLWRRFVSFAALIDPEQLAAIKLDTNALEDRIRREMKGERRCVNLDPGYVSGSALIMATAKDFAHRIPLQNGIYAHLEVLFGKNRIRVLDWTYPDFRSPMYHDWLLEVRRLYLAQRPSLTG